MKGRKRRLEYASRINKFRRGKNEKEKKRQGSEEVVLNKTAELVRKAVKSNVVKESVDTSVNIKF